MPRAVYRIGNPAFASGARQTEERSRYTHPRWRARGSCSGLSYVLDVDPRATDKDDLYEVDGLPVVIDRKSKQFLEGTVIDYSFQNLLAGFVFHNPNAERSCGCGSSFTPKMPR